MRPAEVLVVGAGIAGLAAAEQLQRRGVSVQVVERAASLRMTTAGIVLHPNALACLDHLGGLPDRSGGVRQGGNPDAQPVFTGHTFIRTTVPGAAPKPLPEWRTWRAGPHTFGLMPIGQGRMSMFFQITASEPIASKPQDAYEVLRKGCCDMPGEVRDFVDSMRLDEQLVTRSAFAPATGRVVSRRVVLIGDAAHAVSPATAQGGGLAVEEAVAALRSPVPEQGVRSRPTADASAWYRSLYGPLLVAA
ncbi:FAD-dependent oxidoreductase [Streptomyces sp. NPDC048483]|uniref:FAD-dependent oxidoreductase n=1 Tax=Streptomyces sp. NPDC048483 TaxID=3154927 RepID=UPI00344375E9